MHIYFVAGNTSKILSSEDDELKRNKLLNIDTRWVSS